MAESTQRRKDDESWGCLSRWHLAWFRRHEHDLISRMATMEIADHLIEKRYIDIGMDLYQKMDLPATIANDKARLLLKFMKSQGTSCFWAFQEALAKTGCADLAVGREKEQAQIKSFSLHELSTAFYASWEEGRPASVVKVNRKLKERYQDLRMSPLAGTSHDEHVSLDDIRVNIALLSTDKLDAMCGSPGQRQPFVTSALKEKASSVTYMEDLFEKKSRNDHNLASGGAGSGKSTAFMLKAPFEWSKEERDRAFWSSIGLFFTGSLTDWGWWRAEQLAEVFNLSRFDLTKEEEDEVVRYIKSHSDEVLLVADSMDEARIDKCSLLWQVLTGKCEDLPRLKVIICSRPCEATLLLTKRRRFHRCLEVVGFTEEKIGQFVDGFFKETPHKATELQAQLASRTDVAALMHTPLVATMVCRLFQLRKALPNTQTRVYESAVLAMLEQSVERESECIPESILDELSPPEFQATMENMCKLAFDALAKKQVIFTKSELTSSGCLGAAAKLGLLSSSPGVNIAGYGEDAYSFSHHTILEFFAAVHAVRKCIRTASTTIGEFVEAHSIDGDYSRFWPFVSGLLSGEECEPLLGALATKILAGDVSGKERSRRVLLLLQCYSECVANLPPGGSPAIAMVMKTIGMRLDFTHLSVSDARIVTTVLRQYSSSVEEVSFLSTIVDDIAMPILISALQHCTRLLVLTLPTISCSSDDVQGISKVIDQNKTALGSLNVRIGDDTLPNITSAITKCTRLAELYIGSQSLTNTSAPAVAEVIRNHPSLIAVGLTGQIDDVGFAPIAPCLQSLAKRLKALKLNWTRLSVPMLSSMLPSLTCLQNFELMGNPIDDDGFKRLTPALQQIKSLQGLLLIDVGVTCRSMTEMEKLLLAAPTLRRYHVVSKKDAFLPNGEDTDHIAKLTTMKVNRKVSLSEPGNFHGCPINEFLALRTNRSQELVLCFFI